MIIPINLTNLHQTYQFQFECETCHNKMPVYLFTEGKERLYLNIDSERDNAIRQNIKQVVKCPMCN